MKRTKSIILISILSICILFSSCASSNAKKVIKQIDNIGVVDYKSDVILDKIEVDYQALSQDEKEEVSNYHDYEIAKAKFKDSVIDYLQKEAKNEGLKVVREKIKQSLKSPKSYNEYSCEADSPIILENSDTCSMTIKIKYGATNSFGAEVTDTVSALVSFSVDIENKSITITNTLII